MQSTQFVGIDISAKSFDACVLSPGGKVSEGHFPMTKKGFKRLAKQLDPTAHCVMEATGRYHLPLAIFLHQQGICVSVVNPVRIKRFSQLRLNRTKTDKADAQLITEFARIIEPDPWQPPAKWIQQAQTLISAMANVDKQLSCSRNFLHAMKAGPCVDPLVTKQSKALIRTLQEALDQYQKGLESLISEYASDAYDLLKTISGIGSKTAALILVLAQNFEPFDNVRQVLAFAGLCPKISQSGTSVRGKKGIAKTGNRKLRKNLYVCAWSARRYNPQCKDLYDRLEVAGKPPKVITTAVAAKLLRIAFGVVKSGNPYDPNFLISA